MDFKDSNPQPHRAGQPAPRNATPPGPAARRPVFSDFAPRPHTVQPGASRPVATPAHPAHTPPATTAHRAAEEQLEPVDLAERTTPTHSSTLKEDAESHPTAHSGLVGWIVFVLLAALALSPLLPGKVLQSFPGTSDSTSVGEQTIGCIDALQNVRTTDSTDYKWGFPIVYRYATTSTLRATCDGQSKTATGGQTSQFNPLGAVVNVAGAGIVAMIVAFLWRKLFSPKHR